MRLATFNMESYGFDRFEPEALEHRLEALRPKILELKADILCLQEVNAQKIRGQRKRQFPALDHLLKDTPYQDFYRATSEREPGLGPGNKHNLVILSRYPISKSGCLFQHHADPPYWRPRTAEPTYDEPQDIVFERPILMAEIDIGTPKPLHLFTVHLRAPIAAMIRGAKLPDRSWKSISAWAEGYQLSVLKQTAQALELRLAVETLFDADEKAQIILTGDFNATGETGTLRLLRADPDDTGSPAFVSRRLFQLDRSLPQEERQTVIHRGRGQALDHILASATMTDRTIAMKVFNHDLPDEVYDAEDTDYAGSFHAAMLAEFDLEV
ncbi:MAG: endonuclease/exonuclease/phosphatase family protein [Roseibium sp.]|nr:endonuclease/exonuclease/phosphatase family protein [Roseibium sp.]